MGIMQGLLRRRAWRSRSDGAEHTSASTHTDASPALVMLTPRYGGVTSYELHRFPSARAAEFFLDSAAAGELRRGTVLFWALTHRPYPTDTDSEAEPLVIIRDPASPVVYPFSFSDEKTALDFVRRELLRGMELHHVMFYWAVPAAAEIDFWGRSTVTPANPPRLSPGTIAAPPSEGLFAVAGLEDRRLTGADIEETVDLARRLAEDGAVDDPRILPMPPADSATRSDENDAVALEPIDFPTAAQKLQLARHSRRAHDTALLAWGNFAQALDEAIDAHVSRRVANQLAWNRIVRALAQAALAAGPKETSSPAPAAPEPIAPNETATLEQALEPPVRPDAATSAWSNLSSELAAAAAAREANHMAWSRIGRAISRAAMASIARQLAMEATWSAAADALAAAASAQRRRTAAVAWQNASRAIGHAVRARVRQQVFVLTWQRMSAGLTEAALIHIARTRVVNGCANLSRGIAEAIVAEARLRIARVALDAVSAANVERALRHAVYSPEETGLPARWPSVGPTQVRETSRGLWRSHDEAAWGDDRYYGFSRRP